MREFRKMREMASIFLISLIFSISSARAQQADSRFGSVHTPKGRLHCLVIFIRYEDKNLQPWAKTWPDSDTLPEIAQGPYNELFDADGKRIERGEEKKNLTDFYHVMSGGKFLVTADIFPQQVPVKWVPEQGAGFFSRQDQLNKAAVNWIAENYPDFDWGKYDNRQNNPNFRKDNVESGPDKKLDYVIFLHRNLGFQTGMAATGRHQVPGTDYEIISGLTGIKCNASEKHQWEYFKHEFAHNLFGAPHYMGANKTDGNKLYVQNGWGLMSTLSPIFFTANAWERWWLGWYEPQEVRSAGSYQLRDFVTTGDAMRVQIPGTQDYLWIENHQKKNQWDDKLFYNDREKGHPQISPGIYMYVVAEPGADRMKPHLQTHNPAHCNLMKVLNGQGNWDFEQTGENVEEYFKPMAYRRVQSNPIAGQNDQQSLRADQNNDGNIRIGVTHGNRDGGSGEMDDLWAEEINGKASITLNVMGDENDAFQSGDEISLSGILPALNYPSFDRTNQKLNPYLLNGLRILIGEQQADGTYDIRVEFDDWEVREDTRWCGNFVLPSPASDDERFLEIAKGKTLLLDLSGTPDRGTPHPETQTCVNPTHWVVEGGRTILLQPGSNLIVDEHSILELKEGAQIIIEPGASLQVKGLGKLLLAAESQVIIRKRGKMVVEADGYFEADQEADIDLARRARLRVMRP